MTSSVARMALVLRPAAMLTTPVPTTFQFDARMENVSKEQTNARQTQRKGVFLVRLGAAMGLADKVAMMSRRPPVDSNFALMGFAEPIATVLVPRVAHKAVFGARI